ncbi:MAG: restriction endonuclease subunit S [Bacteroides sp.]
MREGWEYKKYQWNEVLSIINGRNQSAVVCDDGKYPIYGSGGIMGFANDYLCPENCVIIGRKGNINKPIFVTGKFWNVDTAFGLSADGNILLPKYLYYFCLDYNFEKHNKAVTIPSLTKADLLKINISLPCIEHQQSIVSELDKINELIRIKKEQLSDYDKLAQSLFYEMFGDPVVNDKGWEVKKLLQIVSQNCSISYGIVQPGDNVENGVPVVRPIDLISEYIYPTDLKRTTQEISNSYKRSILNGNEILMCVRGNTGVVSLATDALKGCNVTRGISPIQIGENGDRLFMYYQLKTEGISSLIAEKTYGATLKQINMKDLRELPLILPPLPLQQLFASRITQIEAQKTEVQRAIKDLETLLASRMQYWFES